MGYVNVTVIHPDGREYDGDVDDNASYGELLSALTRMLRLSREENGEKIDYRLSISGATRIQPDAVIRVERVTPSPIRKLSPR